MVITFQFLNKLTTSLLMLEEKFDNLIKLINYSNELHKNQISSIKKYIKKSKSNTEKFFELIYSILVGTQIKTNKVKICYDQLLNEYFVIFHPRSLKELEDFTFIKDITKRSLKENGYRFYKTKSDTIYNAILFFKNYNFNIDNFLIEYSDYKSIRKELMKINGVGYKIASHWLRNIGYYIPIIDVHIKKILHRFRIIEGKKLNYIIYENIQNKVAIKINVDNISFDLSLWYYGKNFCGNRRCNNCTFYSICENNF